MTVTPNDIKAISVKDEWIQQGLKYGQLSWTQTFNRMGKASPYKKIQNITLGKIAESAVLDYLKDKKIKYTLKGSTKWYEIDIDDLEINNSQIDVKSFFIDSNSSYIRSKKIENDLEAKLKWYSKCHALVPADQIASRTRGNPKMKKVFVFVFIEGTVNSNSNKNVMHAFWNYSWIKKAEQKDAPHLGKLEINNKSSKPLHLVIYGTTAKNTAVVENLVINPGKKKTNSSYHQVFSVYSKNGIPDGEVVINATNAGIVEIIKPIISFNVDNTVTPSNLLDNNWNALDLNIAKCFISGWLLKDDFIVISKEYPRYTKIFEQYQDTLTSNFACRVTELENIDNIGNI
jgi:hypothetical protein